MLERVVFNLKLFLKEHIRLIVLQMIQFSLIPLILWLDGYDNYKIVFYGIFLGIFFLSCYLIFQYITHRRFYHLLNKKQFSLDESIQQTDHAPLPQALRELLKNQYTLYQNELEDSKRRQREHLQYIDRWVHQMKTPLSVIELTAQDLDEPESSNIREETDRIKMGLNTVLYMARLRSIEQDFHIRPVSLKKIIDDVNREHKRLFIRNEVYPQLQEKNKGITVESDENWMYFILSQLINNAVKYSKGKSNQILISIYERDQEAVLEVRDNGVGIPKTDLKRVFNAFFTGENGRKFRESTGMGLYIVKEVVQYLQHKIELDSQEGEGTTFRIVFDASQNLTKM